jgi:hypothetical protein
MVYRAATAAGSVIKHQRFAYKKISKKLLKGREIMKKALSKIMLLVLCFTFVFTGLVACGTDELDQKIEDVKEQVNQNTTKDQATAAALAELKALVEQVKATADSAALKTSLDAVIADLDALEGAAATQTQLNEVKTGLEAALEANATTDAALKAQLLNAIAAVDTIAKAAATKTDLDAAIAELEALKGSAATKDALDAAIAELEALKGSAATKAALDAAIAELEALKGSAATKAALDAAIAELEALKDAAATKDALTDAMAELNAAIDAVETIANAAATKEEVAAAKTELNAAIDAVEAIANAAATKAELAGVKAEFDAAKVELDAAIAAVKATADAAATKAELEEAMTDVEGAIEALLELNVALDGKITSVKEELQFKVEEVEASVEALTGVVAGNKEALEQAIADAKDALDAKDTELAGAIADAVADLEDADEALADAIAGAKDELGNKIDALEKTVGDNNAALEQAIADAKVALEAKDTELAGAIADAVADLEAADEALADAIADAKTELGNKIDALEKTVGDNNAALEQAIADAKAALEAKDTELAGAIAKAADDFKAADEALAAEIVAAKTELGNKITALEAKDTELAGAIADAKAALEAKDTELAGAIADAVADLEAADEALVADLEGKITAVKTELQGQIDALSEKLDTKVDELTTAITALQGKDTEFAGLLEVIKADIESLKADIDDIKDSSTDFVDNFENATKVLNGNFRVVLDAEGEVEKLVTAEDAEWDTAADYSLAMFATLNTVDDTLYAPVEVEKFTAKFEDLKFFLGRAVSVEAIIDYFTQLDDYKDNMPSLIETLVAQLEAKTKVTTDPADLDEIKATAAMINDFDTNTEYADTYAWFVEIVAAHDNLVAAAADTGAAEAAIDAIGYVKFDSSKALIDAAKVELEKFAATYFSNADYTKYYNDDVTTLVANYADYTAANARYAELTVADATKPEMPEVVTNYSSVSRPLWTDKAELDAKLEEFNAWLALNNIDRTADADSLATMYPAGEIELLDKAVAYATAMDAIYSGQNVEGLNALVDVLVAKTPVLWTDKTESDGYVAAYAALKAAIEAVADYDAALDANYATMVGADRADTFAIIVARHAELDAANAALDALYDAMAGKLGNVTFKDYDAIVKLNADYTAIFTAVAVVKDDANYVEFAKEKDPVALYDALYAEYSVLTAKVREIYDTVTEALADSNTLSLTFGNNIQDYLAHVREIIALGVTDINLPLPGADGAEEVNLATLLANLSKVVKIYTERADAAVAESDAFTTILGTIYNIDADGTIGEVKFNFADLDNFAAVEDVYEALQAWVTKYLGTDDIAYIQEVQKYMAANGTYYAFITVEEYNKAVDAYNKAKAAYDEAEDAWAVVKTELVGLTGDAKNNIHNIDAYNAADKNYKEYVTKYYKADDIVNAAFDEIEVYAAFTADKQACEAKKADADNASTEIKNRIDALAATVDYANYVTVQAEVDTIKALIETYKTNYCPDLCDECIGDARQVVLAQKDALAQLYAYADAAKATNCEVLVDQEVLFYAGLITMDCEFEAIDTIETTLELAKSAVDAAVCVDVEADGDHACDECGAPDITVCADAEADGDHACDECGATVTACADADADGDHACDECGATVTACADADADGDHDCDAAI